MPHDGMVDRPKVRFTPRPDDLIAAQRCSFVMRLRQRSSIVWLATALVAAAAFVCFGMPEASWYWRASVFGGGVLGAMLRPFVSLRWRIPRAATRIFHQQRGLHRELTLSWDENALHYGSDQGGTRTAFVDYLRWAESGDIILLYHSEALFHFIPKRILEPFQIEDLRSISRHVGMTGA